MIVAPLGPVEALSDTHELDQFDSGVAALDQWWRSARGRLGDIERALGS